MKMRRSLFVVLSISATLILTTCNLELSAKEISVIPTEQQERPAGVEMEPAPQPPEISIPAMEPGTTLLWTDSSLLVYIPPGEFIMGLGTDDAPEHLVYLDSYWIYRTEVTNRMYARCMAMGECAPPEYDPSIPDIEDPSIADMPVVNIFWEQAENYCHFIGGHLPTEAQWEKVARGPEGNIFPWGNAKPNCELLNFNDCLGERSNVVSYPLGISYYDIFDMAGNVYEWVYDWYQPNYYFEEHFDNPVGPEEGEVRSVRGSAFNSVIDQVPSAMRYFEEPELPRVDLGFRCVVEQAQEFAPKCEMLAFANPDLVGEPGDAPGGSAACVVSQPMISVITYCENGIRGNNISWSPADAEVDYSTHEGAACAQYDVDTLACVGSPGASVNIKVCKSCPPPVVDLGVIASCAPPYVFSEVDGLCQYAGDPIPDKDRCPPRYALEEARGTLCCQMEGGTPFDYPVCPIGGRYDPVSRICWFTLPSTGDEKCASQTVYFDPCAKPTDDDDGQVSVCAQYNLEECRKHINDGCYWDWNNNVCLGP